MIHRFTLFGTHMVVDVNSGAVHMLDDVSFDVLEHYKTEDEAAIVDRLSDRYGKTQIIEAIGELKVLEDMGQLYSEDIYIEHVGSWDKKPVVKALCLHVSHDCNLRCKYCFAATGDFGGGRTVMSAEIGKKAIDFLINASSNRKNLEIDFFGGEPLLNFDVVKEVIGYALRKETEYNKKFKFTLTTNAVLLNEEHKKYINEHIQNIVLSLDGRKDTNDRMRFRVDGSGTYKDILPKIKDLAESRNQDNYYVRGTFTRENLDFSQDVLHLADEGFQQVSVEPVVAAKGSGYDIRDEDLPVIFNEYEKLASKYVERKKTGRGFNFFHFMIDLSQGPCVAKRLKGCGSGHEYVAVTPDGDIFPCHQFVGMDEFKMGNVNDGVMDSGIQSKFKNSNIYSKNECRNCWAKFYCSGGCAANAYQFNQDINIPYRIGCELEKKRVECALWIKAQEL